MSNIFYNYQIGFFLMNGNGLDEQLEKKLDAIADNDDYEIAAIFTDDENEGDANESDFEWTHLLIRTSITPFLDSLQYHTLNIRAVPRLHLLHFMLKLPQPASGLSRYPERPVWPSADPLSSLPSASSYLFNSQLDSTSFARSALIPIAVNVNVDIATAQSSCPSGAQVPYPNVPEA
ncbi:hypothetical protein CPB83DRAFT_890751 [Crepidotus variabilis]|uniref:Uncharacterized protein n=1 Tax=Crepidotus variabilis TaxID=179855 RepID=A0A9P6EPE8_9AGAR|nr:hypothetical protein CPB83DRAFT_890751 [Crepidotus variabilis]